MRASVGVDGADAARVLLREPMTGGAEGGPIGIHGTDEPTSIGRPMSNGCVRVANDVIERLYREIDSGTPVVIRA